MLKEKLLSVSSASKKLPLILIILGSLAILSSFLIFLYTFFPVIKTEINYSVSGNLPEKSKVIVPVDKDFGIVIPKINANSKVIADVDPYNEQEYQWALTKGVAQAKGTALPGEEGNVFIFSHSSVNFYEAAKYNSVFYLLSKLERGDEVILYYQNKEFKYKVTDKITVDPANLSYLTEKTSKKMLTLMTCWPPGTTLKRLIIIAEMSDI